MAARKRGRPRRVRYRRLRQLMAAMSVSAVDIGDVLGLAGSTISRKLSGQLPWTLDEAHRVMEFLQVSPTEMYLYFPKDGEDADSVQQQQIHDYLQETNQALISQTALDTLVALVGSIEAHSTTTPAR